MGNEISTPETYGNAPNAFKNIAFPIEILFDVLAFVKFHEAPNIFLINRHLLSICQVYFHSGTVGLNKFRNVRTLIMELREGLMTMFVERNGTWQSVPTPEVDPPKIFNAFGEIIVRKCCRIEAMQFLNKFSSLLTSGNNSIFIHARNFFPNIVGAIADESKKQINSNSASNVDFDEKQFFLNWIEQKKILLELKADASWESVARCLADEPLIAQFNGSLCMTFVNEKNLCGLEEDAQLIYGWISTGGTRKLQINHYDAEIAWELACQIALLFKQAHVNKIEVEKMDLAILLPKDIEVPKRMQTACNGKGDELGILRTISVKLSDETYKSAYIFYTKSMDFENMEEDEKMVYLKAIEFP